MVEKNEKIRRNRHSFFNIYIMVVLNGYFITINGEEDKDFQEDAA